MTGAISPQVFELLANHREPLSISLYMPTHRTSFENQQDPIRFKNLLGKVEQQCLELGLRRSEVEKRLLPLRRLLDDPGFWQHQKEGLAVFMAADDPMAFRTPLSFAEFGRVSDRFHLKPLLPLVARVGHFYILSISQDSVKLYQADRHHLEEITPEQMPRDISVVTQYYDSERQLQFHTETPSFGPVASRSAIFHGQGVGTDEAQEKKRLDEYCNQINSAVEQRLRGRSAPLLLVATEPLLGRYREHSSYAHLEQEALHINPDILSQVDLHREALAMMLSYLESGRIRSAARYRDLTGQNLVSNNLEEIVRAAQNGQIETLFVPMDEHRWGRYHPETRQLEIHDQPQPGDQDLLNFASVQAHLHGSAVHVVPRTEMPEPGQAAAIYRYVPVT